MFMPICINMAERRVLMVGGGQVAAHKLKNLLCYTRRITVCAPSISETIAAEEGLTLIRRPYDAALLEGVDVVYACTDDPEVNLRVRRDALDRRLLVCVADHPKACDFISPAIYRRGEMTVAVSSNGTHVRRSLQWRDRIRALLENDPVDGM